jgi:dihydroflavonol-4-reductase
MVGKKVVLTGGTGHIGSTVAHILLKKGYDLTLLIRTKSAKALELEAKGAKLHQADLMDASTYSSVLVGQDALFHLAAENTTNTDDEQRVIQASLGLTEVVLTAAQVAGIKTILYTSSVVVLGRSPSKTKLVSVSDRVQEPESPYVKGKLLAEQWVETQLAKGADIRRLYPSWVVGSGNPGLTPPHKFIKDFATKGQLIYFDGGVSIAHVQDVALGHVLAYEKGSFQGAYVLSGENLTFKDLYDELGDLYRVPKPKIKIPKWLIYSAAKVLGKASPVQAAYVKSVIGRYSWYDNTPAKTPLGYQARPAKETLLEVKNEIHRRLTGTFFLTDKKNSNLASGAELGTLLITGFPGWLGNRMVDILANGDHSGNFKTNRQVRLLVQPGFLDLLPTLPSNFEVSIGDITNPESLEKATLGISTVWHLAGVIYPKNLELFAKVNEQGTKNLADACVKNGVKRFLYMSTDSVCGYSPNGTVFAENEPAKPYKNYGKSKYAGEKYLQDLTAQGKLAATTFRGFWFFGPNIPSRNLAFFQSFSWPRQIVFGNGKNLRSISHCDDITRAFCMAEKSESTHGKWYWLPTVLPPQTVKGIYEMVAAGLHKEPKYLFIPNFVCDFFGWADSILTERFGILNPTVHAAGKFHKFIATDEKGIQTSVKDFGWQPTVSQRQIQEEIVDSLAKN